MRALLLVLASAVLVVASSLAPQHQLGREARLQSQARIATATATATSATFVTCVSCEAVLFALDGYLNTTSIGTLQATLQKACFRLTNGTARIACYVLAAKLADVLKELPDTLSTGGVYPVRVVCGLAGLCELPCCNGTSAPEQVYITFGDTGTTMRATWITLNDTASVVQWGRSPSRLTSNATGATTTYTRGGWRGTVHHSTMLDLKASGDVCVCVCVQTNADTGIVVSQVF